MKRKGFTFVEVIVSLLLISILLMLVNSSAASLMQYERKQETQIAGNEYINFLRKKALASNNGLDFDDFYKNNDDVVAREFYEDYHPDKDFPHQTSLPTKETPIATEGLTLYVYHFHLLKSNDSTDESTETIITFSTN